MSGAFGFSTVFNQPLDQWNVEKVNNIEGMFFHAHGSIQNTGSWKLKSVGILKDAFDYSNMSAYNFTKTLTAWTWDTTAKYNLYLLPGIFTRHCLSDETMALLKSKKIAVDENKRKVGKPGTLYMEVNNNNSGRTLAIVKNNWFEWLAEYQRQAGVASAPNKIGIISKPDNEGVMVNAVNPFH